jgi:hypothetical protein
MQEDNLIAILLSALSGLRPYLLPADTLLWQLA